jgi:CoA:oxalate CoA-transferase
MAVETSQWTVFLILDFGQEASGQKLEEIRWDFRKIFRTKTRAEWFDLLSKTAICVGKVLTMDETARDPHLKARQMFVELEHPQEGKVKQVGISLKFSETPGSIRRFPPGRGQHTEEVLKELGYGEEEISALRMKGCVQ